MRPAVYASVVRNRKQNARRIRLRAPTFSVRRLMVMIFVGGCLFIPGLTLTVMGIENEEENLQNTPAQKVLYKVLGPCACAMGVCVLIGGALYYFCYGLANPARPRHPSSGSSGGHHSHSQSAYSSVKSTHIHDDNTPNGDSKSNSTRQHKRSSSCSSGHHHHHHHQSPRTQSEKQHTRQSTTPQRQEEEVPRARQAESEDVTITLENNQGEVEQTIEYHDERF